MIPLVSAAAALLSAAPGPAQQDWGAIARKDVLAAYDLYVADHPGMHDPSNPGFQEQLKRARDVALRAAEGASDRSGYEKALGLFSAELSDGHAQIGAKDHEPASEARWWPGFVAAWRGRMIVRETGPDFAMPIGAEIVSCDGLPVADFVKQRLLTQSFRPREAGAWWSRAQRAFDSTAGDPDRPKRCEFKTPGGIRAIDLAWSKAPADLVDRFRRSSDGDRTEIGLTEPRPGLFLIGMPTFSPDKTQSTAYADLFRQLERRRSELAQARAVVIDLRHNDGGSSSWSRDAARLLWGKKPVDQRMTDYRRNVSIWWRASEGNLAFLRLQEGEFRQRGNGVIADYLGRISVSLAAAKASGQTYYVERNDEAPSAGGGAVAQTSFKTPVYAITPGRCASACLDALDTFTRFGNVRLIGAPTSADSTYMEVRTADLPSGYGLAIIPMKFWAGRPRASGAVYRPDIEFDQLQWSTSAFLDRIEADLKR